jgi:CubicO group peptidase (beta-lactamase class C family)
MKTRNLYLILATALVLMVQPLSAVNTFSASTADSLIMEAIHDSIVPGAVLCVVEEGKITYLQAYGNRAIVPAVETMTTNTIFDLASVSKPTGAGTAMLLLCAEGKASVDDYVAQYIPNYHADVQIRHLMTHYSGLPSYMNARRLDSIFHSRGAEYDQYPDFMIDTIARCKRPSAVGEKYRYSCLNFISLQRVVENIVGTDINSYLRNTHYKMLGIPTMGWLPNDSLLHRIAPTECTDTVCLRGLVHDPLAQKLMRGISGNAGVFATAEEVATWAIWFMNLDEETRVKGCNAGLWRDSVTTSMGIETPSCRHTGYTGTSVTILPKEKRALVLLTNRVHPKDEHSLAALRKALNALLTP